MQPLTQGFPLARKDDLLVSAIADEVVLFDSQCNKAYCLNHTAALVWKYSDGATPVSEIARRLQKELQTPVDEILVYFALQTLEKDGLLQERLNVPAAVMGLSRRDVIRMLGKGAAVAVPLVILMAVPSAAQAQSGGGGCVLQSTPILSADGQLMAATDVVVGQTLLGVNTYSGQVLPARVSSVGTYYADSFYSLITESGHTLQCSPSHPMMTPEGDIQGERAESLKVRDSVWVMDGQRGWLSPSRLAAVDKIKIQQPVIWFSMESAEHTFISGGIVSHNKEINDRESHK